MRLSLFALSLLVCAAASADEHAASTPRTEQDWKAFVQQQLAAMDKPHLEPVDPDPFAFSTYKGVRPEPMGEQTIINGSKMRIASLVVEEPPHVVEGEYMRMYDAQKVPAFRGEVPNTRGVRYLAFRPTGSKNLKTITLIPRGRGTVVLASIGDPSRMLLRQSDLPAGVPLPDNATAAASIAQTESGARSHTSSYVIRGTTVEQVRAFFRQELVKQGFTGREGAGPGGVDAYERGTLQLSVSAQPAQEAGAVTLSVVWIE